MGKKIILKTESQINDLRESGKYLNELLHLVMEAAKPGVTGLELENLSQKFLNKHKISGAFKGFMGFPANLCLSVNDCVVHGIPDKTVYRNGDVLKIDVGVKYNKMITDSAVTIVIGGSEENKRGTELITTTKFALDSALKHIYHGNPMFDYSNEIWKQVEGNGFKIIKSLTGHGVGVAVHEGPFIHNWPHYDTKEIKFEKNMVIALEPITSEISDSVVERKNHWNLYTRKGDLGAQWEYTVAVTDNGIEILSGIV
ncbi:MAG: type I methionyl aminopeptidase [Candidatus Absconditabacteria bacterium]